MNGAGTVFTGFVDGVVSWLRMPYDTKGSAFNWFMFVGLIIVAIGLWNIILLDITRE